MPASTSEDPNLMTWAQYLKEEDDQHACSSSDDEDDFRGDSLNDADWDGQGGGIHRPEAAGAHYRLYKTVQPAKGHSTAHRSGNTATTGTETKPANQRTSQHSPCSLYVSESRGI